MSDPLPYRAPGLPKTITAVAVLLGVKAALGLWLTAVLFSASAVHHRRFLGEMITARHARLGVVILVFCLATIAMLVGLLTLQAWARIGVLVLEAASVILALTRIGSHPGSAVVSLAFSAVIVSLVLTRTTAVALRGAGQH